MIVEGNPDHEHWGRRLMASVPDNETEPKNCSAPARFPLSRLEPCEAIHEFPDDLFTNNERKSGAILLHIT
ncbi:hypothetical protein INR49_028660, partial [Caranx melampygus]